MYWMNATHILTVPYTYYIKLTMQFDCELCSFNIIFKYHLRDKLIKNKYRYCLIDSSDLRYNEERIPINYPDRILFRGLGIYFLLCKDPLLPGPELLTEYVRLFRAIALSRQLPRKQNRTAQQRNDDKHYKIVQQRNRNEGKK